jgi:hypothetical protein
MRLVAKFQFTTTSSGSGVVQAVSDVLDRWSNRKFDKKDDGSVAIRQSGAPAVFERSADEIDDKRRDTFIILEPIVGGSLQTDIDVLAEAGRTFFRCRISVATDGGIVPTGVPLRPPRFVREIVGLGMPWTIGIAGERVFVRDFPIDVDDVPELEELIFAPQRRLPVVIVSELNGETLAGDIQERLSQDLCGIAHTVRLSHEAGWELTRSRGREWSCYNGAIRLLWPLRSNSHDYRAHPLWTPDSLLRLDTAVQARDRLRGIIAGRILEASTFVADDPAFHDFEVAKLRRAAEQVRAAAKDDGDMNALADAYAKENDALRARVDAQDKEISTLQGNIEALNIALRSAPSAGAAETNEAPPQTISQAVASARVKLAGRVVIASETDADIDDLNPSAGPPDKVLRYLLTLGDLADALSEGPLGQSVPIWLRDRNVECSGDSETAKASDKGKRFRNRVVEGENVECEFHAKPAEGVSPDLCARIYFATGSEAPFVKVGYIGRHLT